MALSSAFALHIPSPWDVLPKDLGVAAASLTLRAPVQGGLPSHWSPTVTAFSFGHKWPHITSMAPNISFSVANDITKESSYEDNR